ncbi:MAG: FAD-binding oxidoreductase [Gemmatimonadaceae bacterium]
MASCHIPPAGFRGIWRDDALARAVYSEAAGIGRIVPAAVAVPVDADDVVTLVRYASERSISLVPRGSGTSMAGGAIGPGIVVDLSRIDRIEDVDQSGYSVWAGAGALRGAVNRAAYDRGLRFPVDPSSGEYCTIGGMAATNAAGAHSLRFGPTRDWVLALDCVFADGTRAVISRIAPAPEGIPALDAFFKDAVPRISEFSSAELSHQGVAKDSSGYGLAAYRHSGKLVDLLVGSEGTLALIVGVQVALAPLARATSSVLGAFASLDAAVAAATVARKEGAVACELLDKTFLDVAALGDLASSASGPLTAIPSGTEAVLLANVEAADQDESAVRAAALERSFDAAGATLTRIATGFSDQHELWELRHAASPILSRLDPSLKSMQFIEDGAVPSGNLADYVRGVRAALDSRGIRGVIFGHAGDAHMHVNPLIDVTVPDWREKLEGLLSEVVDLTARLGGTLAGEHGDGRLRAPLLPHVWDEKLIDLFSLVKRTFDPLGILNPGVKVPLPGQKPVTDVKYDPAIAPLPDRARAALDLVAAERRYATLRLDLIV